MSFWNTTSGEKATGEVKENSMEPLARGWYTCMLEEVANKEWEDDRYINLKARVVAGPSSNRVVFLKLKVYETNSQYYKAEARDNAIQKLVKLYSILKADTPKGEPDDRNLSQLIDKPLDIHLDVWKDNDTKEPKGNFIINFAARGSEAGNSTTTQARPAPSKTSPVPKRKPAPDFSDMSDDIPF